MSSSQRVAETNLVRSVGRAGASHANALAEAVSGLCQEEAIWEEAISRRRAWPNASAVGVARLRRVDRFDDHRRFGLSSPMPRRRGWCGSQPLSRESAQVPIRTGRGERDADSGGATVADPHLPLDLGRRQSVTTRGGPTTIGHSGDIPGANPRKATAARAVVMSGGSGPWRFLPCRRNRGDTRLLTSRQGPAPLAPTASRHFR